MIPGSRLAVAGAVAASLAAHGLLALAWRAPDPPRTVGGASDGATVRFGGDFAALASGRTSPVAASAVSPATATTPSPAPVAADRPTVEARPASSEALVRAPRAAGPSPTPASPAPGTEAGDAPATAPAVPRSVPVAPVTAGQARSAATAATTGPGTASSPDLTSPVAPAPLRTAALPAVPSDTGDRTPAAPVVPDSAETVPDAAAPVVSLRPAARPVVRPDPPREDNAAAPSPATRGDPRGTGAAAATRPAADGEAGTGGGGAADAYPGLVFQRIARAGRPGGAGRGTTVVGFTVAPSGGLAALAVARSSGSARLDRAALGIVSRAAPFPPPPAGAQRRFTISIEGR